MASPSRRSGWIIAGAVVVTVLALVALVLWLWLPRWAPVWVVRNSPWFAPAWRAVSHVSMRNLPGDYSPSILTDRIPGRWDATAQRIMIAELSAADPAVRLRIVALVDRWVVNRPLDEAPWAVLLHALLHDPDPQVRVRAIGAVKGRISSGHMDFSLAERKDAVDALIRLTRDPDATVRTAACAKLESANALDAVVDALSTAIQDPLRVVGIAAIQSLRGSENQKAIALLLPLLDHDDEDIVKETLKSLIGMPSATPARDARLAQIPVATVMRWGPNDYDLMRQSLIWGADGLPGLVQALELAGADQVEIIIGQEGEPRQIICRSIASVLAGEEVCFPFEGGDNWFFLRTAERREARQRMVESALRQGVDSEAALLTACADGDGKVRAYALIALRGSTAPAVKRAVIAALDDQDTLPVLQAAQTLVLDQDERALAPLIRLIDADEWYYQASEALSILGDQRAIDPLIRLLLRKLEKREDAADTAFALGEIGDHRAIAPLIAALKSGYDSTRNAACLALATLGDRRAVPALIACLDDQEPEVRTHAALALELLPDARAVDALIRRLTDLDEDVRLKVLVTLARTRDPRALPPLIARLADPDHTTRAVVVKMLGESGDPRAVDPLLALFDRPDEKIPILTWAVDALERLPKTEEQRARMCSPSRPHQIED